MGGIHRHYWLWHLMGATFFFFLGMCFAVRRMPMPILAYHLIRKLRVG